MAKAKKTATSKKPIEQYEHKDKKRLNNPPVGLVDVHSDNGGFKKQTYAYDQHLDPSLQWTGKTEHTSFEVPTVSLHVHERIDPRRIIEQVKKEPEPEAQLSLFQSNTETRGLSKALEFYKHKENWSNRLIAGDSLLVMNSLLQKESMGEKVQMIFFDPPYGIRYGSNFQPFVNKKDVKDGNDGDLTAEPEMIKAFRDTWELGIHSYLTYLRDRLKLANDLLHESGSVFIQISDENVHHVRELMDEIFGSKNFVALIPFRKKTMPFGATFIEQMNDFIIFYAKSKANLKYRQLFVEKDVRGDQDWDWFLDENGNSNKMTDEQHQTHYGLPKNSKIFRLKSLEPSGIMQSGMFDFEFKGKKYLHPSNGYGTTPDGMKILEKKNRLQAKGNLLNYRLLLEDYPYSAMTASWYDTVGADKKKYVVQTNTEVVKRCLLMATDPGDLVLDITCGSGTTAFVAENWGRRWITCDTSRVALTLAKQRLLTANFDYFELAYPNEGVGSGFKYKTVPHITLGSIANNEPAPEETLYDQPFADSKRQRVTGPFTVEAVPSPVVRTMEETENNSEVEADISVARSGETLRQNNWIDELKNTGVRGKQGSRIEFTRMETAIGFRYVQAEGETKEDKPKKVYVVFAPEFAPLEQRMVELAWEEVKPYKPDILLFCALQFDEEAAKDIDEMNPAITKCQFLKAQMNADLHTDDLKKKRSSNESFWLIGQPEAKMKEIKSGEHKGKFQVEVLGFDYYNPKTGTVEGGGKGDIAMWMLDTDYDGRSLFPSQVFFPMAGAKDGWVTIGKNLKAEIDEEKIQTLSGTVSLPFTPGKAVGVKIIDARGIESLKIIRD
jgi:adenine-specific DNA-methyltransferase